MRISLPKGICGNTAVWNMPTLNSKSQLPVGKHRSKEVTGHFETLAWIFVRLEDVRFPSGGRATTIPRGPPKQGNPADLPYLDFLQNFLATYGNQTGH